jgi:hypothetical protein
MSIMQISDENTLTSMSRPLVFASLTHTPLLLAFCLQALQQFLPREAIPPRGRLTITAQQMRGLIFDPVIDPIVQALWDMLSKTRSSDGRSGANVLVMAGGFGSSRYVDVKPRDTLRAAKLHDDFCAAVSVHGCSHDPLQGVTSRPW